MLSETFLAVVPIFMSAGAAVMPTIVAAFVSIVAVMLKPRELLRLMRRRPLAGFFGMLVVAIVAGGTWWLLASTPVKAAGGGGAAPRGDGRHAIDWAKVAEDILAREALGAGPVSAPPVGTPDPSPQSPSPTEAVAVIQGRNAGRTSFGGGAAPLGLKPLWNFRPEGAMFLAAPAIVGDRIYAAGAVADLGGYTGLLACLDARTGKPLWQINETKGEIMKPFFSSPAITADGKHLIIGQGLHQDKDCELLCFDTQTGNLKWSVKTPLHIESSPAIYTQGDLAVVGAGAIEGSDRRVTGDPGFVMAVRISDGKLLWKQAVNDPESSPAIDEQGIVYIGSGFNGQAIVALRSQGEDELKAAGLSRILWRTPVEYPVTSAMALTGDLVVAGAGNGDVVSSARNPRGLVVALDRKTGEVRWKRELEDSVIGGVAVLGETAVAPVRTGEVVALSLKDGAIQWRARISGRSAVLASCAFTGSHVYAISSDGILAVVDARDGAILEKHPLNDQANPGTGLCMSPPQVFNGRVVAGSETGGLRCFIGTGVTP